MKALMRHKNEIVRYCDGIEGIDWKTGAPLTNPEWCGGPYILVNDYVPEDPVSDFVPVNPASEPAQDPVEEAVPDTIVIDGVTYTRTS